jgi:nitroreductase
MTERSTSHPIDPLFLERWSPRAFDRSAMPEADLLTLFEAARWAPSAFNTQPARFVYVLRDDPEWTALLGLLIPWNQAWAASASALVFILSDSLMATRWGGEQVSHSHSFDAGAAWAHLALLATGLGYQAHGMTGVEFEQARDVLGVPERFRIEAAAAIGRLGDPATLPDKLREREGPSGRRPLDEIVFRGRFPG